MRTIIPICIGTHTTLSIGERPFTWVTAGGIRHTILVGTILSIGLGIVLITIRIIITSVVITIILITIYVTTTAMTTTQTFTEEFRQAQDIFVVEKER